MSLDTIQKDIEALPEPDFQLLISWVNDEVERRRNAPKVVEAVQAQQAKDAQALWEAHPELKPKVAEVKTPEKPVGKTVEEVAKQLSITEYKQPTGAHDAYPKGAKFLYAGHIWETLIDGYVWPPTSAGIDGRYVRDVTSLFVGDVEDAPAPLPNGGAGDGVESFKQPTGGHDAYKKGDKVLFEGDVYESLIDNNVWSPTGYPQGWKKL